jgi:hypothetical protein
MRRYFLENLDTGEFVKIEATPPFSLSDFDLAGGTYQISALSDPAETEITILSKLPFNISIPVMPAAFNSVLWEPSSVGVWDNTTAIVGRAVVDGEPQPPGGYVPLLEDVGQSIFWREEGFNLDGEVMVVETQIQTILETQTQPALTSSEIIRTDNIQITTDMVG